MCPPQTLMHITRYKVMSCNQLHFGVQERHIMFEGPMQLNYNVLVSMYFFAMVVFQFAFIMTLLMG